MGTSVTRSQRVILGVLVLAMVVGFIVVQVIGGQVARGELPDDMELLGGVVRDIAYRNAVRYFGVGAID